MRTEEKQEKYVLETGRLRGGLLDSVDPEDPDLVWRYLILQSMSRCPAEYCSITSLTSYGLRVSLKRFLLRRNCMILKKTETCPQHWSTNQNQNQNQV